MAKKSQYFSHDYSARRDPKIIELQRALGMEGYGIWWALIEILYEQGGFYPTKGIEGLAYELRVDSIKVERTVNEFGLFERTEDGQSFFNASVLDRLGTQTEISRKRSEAGRLGGLATRQNESIPRAVLQAIAESVPINDRAPILRYDNQRELESIFGVFYFDRNCAEAGIELARFINNYQSLGWMRNGEHIADRVSLARAWNLKSGKHVTEAAGALAYLKGVYIQMIANGCDDRWRLLKDIKTMRQDAASGFTYQLTQEARQIIEQIGLPCRFPINYEEIF